MINPKADYIFDLKAYPSILDIEEPIDLALILLRASLVPNVVRDCVKKNVKGIIVITAGFGETGGEGKKIEEETVKIAREGGARIIGPNCMGVFSASAGMNTTGMPEIPQGPIALVAQSGNVMLELNNLALKRGIGFSKIITTGNVADVDFYEYLRSLREDEDTKVVLMFIEGLKNGRKFLEEAKKTMRIKPVVVMKVGRTEVGRRSAASHTGVLAGSEAIYDAAFKQAGVVRVLNSDELYDIAATMASLPPAASNKIAIVSDSGGQATIAADAALMRDLEIPTLSNETQKKLQEVLYPGAPTRNPVDFALAGGWGDPSLFLKCSDICLQDGNVDGLIMVGLFGGYQILFSEKVAESEKETAHEIAKLVKKYNKPIIMHTLYAGEELEPLEVLKSKGIPVYTSIERATRCMSALSNYGMYLRKTGGGSKNPHFSKEGTEIDETIRKVINAGRVNLTEPEAKEILKRYDIPAPEFKVATNEEEAAKIAEEMGYPVVMKVVSPQIIHKSDAGGVGLDLKNGEEVKKAFREILRNAHEYNKDAEILGVVISPMMPKGAEVIIGVTKDPTFGPTIMFGLGGIFVEVLRDVSFRILPLEEKDAREMVKEIRAYPILEGLRGEKPKDIDAIIDTMMKVSKLVMDNKQIRELDLNPIFVYPDGISAIDARIILEAK